MDEMMTHEEINQWIIENIKKFKNWYHPVDFGDGIVVHCTDEKNMPQPAWDEYHGINKWEKMIKPYAPKIKGKRILDIGCNTGIIDIHLVKKGAKEVVKSFTASDGLTPQRKLAMTIETFSML